MVLVLRRPLPFSAWLLVGAVAIVTASLRLIYPAAVVLVGQARPAEAVVLVVCSLALSLVRGFAADRATRSVRTVVFAALGSAIERFPVLLPPGAPPVEQIENEIARGAPWVESYVGVTLPSMAGHILAAPLLI